MGWMHARESQGEDSGRIYLGGKRKKKGGRGGEGEKVITVGGDGLGKRSVFFFIRSWHRRTKHQVGEEE